MRAVAAAAAALGLAVVVAAAANDSATLRASGRVPAPGATADAPSTEHAGRAGSRSETPGRSRPPAAGGVGILASAVHAQAVVTGIVAKPRSIDLHGWCADLRIDRVLLGPLRLGDTVTIAWEELSAARQVRFVDGERVLAVLDPLPTQSLWRQRFPAGNRATPVLVVAAGGEAFLPRPDGFTVDALEHYLAMTPDARDGPPGGERLAELVRAGDPAVAREALARIDSESASGERLGADGAATLLAAAGSAEREPALRSAALELAARHRLPGTRETAVALTAAGSPVRGAAYRALAALPDGLPPDRREALLGDPDPELRAIGAELATGAVDRARLVTLRRDDPSPTVRLAAGRALLRREQAGAIADVVDLLDDPDGAVRSGIAESIGALGTPAVAPLRAVVDGGSERAALAAVLGLSRAGREGAAALKSIAETAAKPSVRAMAQLALGKAPAH